MRARAMRASTSGCSLRAPKRCIGEHMMEARDELRVEIDNVRPPRSGPSHIGVQDDARAALSSLHVFFWAHGWHEGSKTFAQLVELLELSPGSPLDAGKASDVLLCGSRVPDVSRKRARL